MDKKIIYILLFFVVFSSFLLKVDAKKTDRYQSGDCIYVFNLKDGDKEEIINIRINQDEEGKITYYYANGEKLTDPNSDKWKKELKSLFGGFHILTDKNESYWSRSGDNHFTYCPKYGYIKKVLLDYNVSFTDDSTIEDYVAKVEPDSCCKINLKSIISIEDLEEIGIIKDSKLKTFENCEEVLGYDIIDLLKNIVSILRILVPILLNIFGVVDFGKAIFAGDEDKMKKAQKTFITRLIIGVVIFLIPSLLKLVLNVAHSIWPVIDNSLCGILD